MLGILLRTPWQAIRARIHAELVAAGFSDVRPRDLAVLQWPGPDGMRAIDIAANASMSKQAVKPLIDHLEERGYLTRVRDPDDHRAQRIHTTPRGQQLMTAASTIITEIDRDIEQQLGPTKNAQLRAILEHLATITTHTHHPRTGRAGRSHRAGEARPGEPARPLPHSQQDDYVVVTSESLAQRGHQAA
jgi:DNA-binding MarR family transcriptional regulator